MTSGTTEKNRTGAAKTTPHYLWSIREKDQKPTDPTRRMPCWESGPAMSPSGKPGLGITMRVWTHGFLCRVPSLIGEKLQEAALTAPEGVGGSKLLLLDEI